MIADWVASTERGDCGGVGREDSGEGERYFMVVGWAGRRGRREGGEKMGCEWLGRPFISLVAMSLDRCRHKPEPIAFQAIPSYSHSGQSQPLANHLAF